MLGGVTRRILPYLSGVPHLHVKNEKGTGAEMRPAIVPGIVTENALVSCWPIFFPVPSTGSRGDVFVVKTRRKPLKNGLLWSRYSFVTHCIGRKPRDWGLARSAFDEPCAGEDMACGFWFSKWRTTKSIWVSKETVYSRFIKIPLG